MTERVPLPADLVSIIKAIINQDRRERRAAGFRYQSRHLADRLAEHFGLSIHTLRSIKERKRRRHVWALDRFRGLTVAPERLAAIRMRLERRRYLAARKTGIASSEAPPTGKQPATSEAPLESGLDTGPAPRRRS
jgi:hypothetical protein